MPLPPPEPPPEPPETEDRGANLLARADAFRAVFAYGLSDNWHPSAGYPFGLREEYWPASAKRSAVKLDADR